jgi:iron(III) transport system substrate-binding protein
MKKINKFVASAAATALLAAGALTNGAAAAAPTITIYEATGYASDEIKAFNKSVGYTAIKDYTDSTGPLLAKVAAESNNPQWNLLWVDGAEAFAYLDKQGQLDRYTPKGNFNDLGTSLFPASHAYVPLGASLMGSFIYNAEKVKDVPATYSDLAKAEYKGLLGMNNPAVSGPTFPFIAGLFDQVGGKNAKASNANLQADIAAGESFLKSVKSGNGILVNDRNGPTTHAFEIGQISIALIQSTAALNEINKLAKTPIPGVTPKIGFLAKPSLVTNAIAISRAGSPTQKQLAKRFIDFILSPAGQAIASGSTDSDSYFWPVTTTGVAKSFVPALPAYHLANPYVWGPQQPAIDDWFLQNIK